MKKGGFWEEDTIMTRLQKKQDVTASLNKVPSHMANTDKNNGLT